MGNHLACVSSGAQFRGVQVLHADSGFLSELEGTAKVAELMMENSDQFVCHAKAIQIRMRCSPLPADEELKIGELYILLPMRKLHARLSPEEIAFLSSAMNRTSSKKRSKECQSKVYALPLSNTSAPSNLPDKNAGHSGMENSIAFKTSASSSDGSFLCPALSAAGMQQLMMCRAQAWVPKLETIAEIVC